MARPSEPLSRASSLYDEDLLANEAEPTASLPKLGLDAKGLRASTAVGIVTDYLVSLGISREELDAGWIQVPRVWGAGTSKPSY